MDAPSSRDNAEARNRHHSAVSSFKPGTVTLAGVSYKGAVSRMAETFVLTERGSQKVQSCRVTISKSLLAAAPSQGQSMRINGKAFKIVEVDGFDDGDQHWHLTGQRTPGGDT